METSVAQEYHKIIEEWRKIDKLLSWKLAVWVSQYADVEIIDKFIEIERSPIGIFDDVFFRFESVYQGDISEFEKKLFKEFCSWFEEPKKGEISINTALYESGLITSPFVPNTNLEPNSDNLWKEMLRLRDLIQSVHDTMNFCVYFPIIAYNEHNISDWFEIILEKIPNKIRLVTIDFAQDRKIKIEKYNQRVPLCVYLYPKLDMGSAIKNEMSKDGGSYETIDVQARFRKQVIKVMESTLQKQNNVTANEVGKLIDITNEIGTTSSYIAGRLIGAQAYYTIRDFRSSEKYIDEALIKATFLMQEDSNLGYPLWKSCMLLKAALLYGKKELKSALETYQKLADVATEQHDSYYIMEGNRLVGHLYYELNELHLAFQSLLVSLTAGAYLDISVRRQSTFLHVCYMLLFIGKKIRMKEEVKELELQIQEWLGDDWELLLKSSGISDVSLKVKGKLK
ncbi:hypothetical protein [Capnocytophaga canimorsus]|uniref:hypothetical protein n=1 Tax=Capnocytophaga canimorsus TaxID=28188 RepID=UPI0037CDB152